MGGKRTKPLPEQGTKKARLGNQHNADEGELQGQTEVNSVGGHAQTELKSVELHAQTEAKSVEPSIHKELVDRSRSAIRPLASKVYALQDETSLARRRQRELESGLKCLKRKHSSGDASATPVSAEEQVTPKASLDDKKRRSQAKDCTKAAAKDGDTTPVRQREIPIEEAAKEEEARAGLGKDKDEESSGDEDDYEWLFYSESNDFVPKYKVYIDKLVREKKAGKSPFEKLIFLTPKLRTSYPSIEELRMQ